MSSLNQRLPPLATLIPFEAAFRHRNFTRAAEELHYSQATVSRRVSELETHLGIRLFDRGRHDVTPTAEAESLAATLRLTLGELASVVESIRRQSSESKTLTIFSDLSLATTLVAPIIGDFRRLNPDLEIRVLSSFEPIARTNEEFDIGLQYGRDDEPSLISAPIADDAVFPVCSPEFARKLPYPLTVDDLKDLPLLHVDYGDTAWADWQQFLTLMDATNHPVAEGLTFTSYLVCLDVAEQGEGVALGWERTVQSRLDAGRLVRLPNFTMPRPDAISAYRPSGHPPNPHVDKFLAVLKKSLRPGGDQNSVVP